MENRICFISKQQLPLIKEKYQSIKGIWIAKVDGDSIKDWNDYAHAIEKAMHFPTPCEKSFPVYADWMTDLDWLNATGYVIIINNFSHFMEHDKEKKNIVIKAFKKEILPWWQGEVEKCVVGGKAKPFDVYLVD